jgi:glycosyltransferase involved in cell wall biosynthesis
MKIGFAGRWSPYDKKSWSGTYYYSCRAIEQHHEVTVFQFNWSFWVREWLLLKKQYGKKILHKEVAVEFLSGYARHFSSKLDEALKGYDIDVIYAPAAPQLIAFAKTTIPIIFLTDASFQQIQGYYNSYQNLASFSLRQGIDTDKRAFHTASHCLLASEWCRQSAIKDYGVDPVHITVAPLGANLDQIPDAYELDFTKNDETCRLLFLGVEWERKGGQIAYDTFVKLRREGFPVTLTIIGCVPPFPVEQPGVEVIPFLDKHDPAQSAKLYQYLKDSSFLFLPTRAECAGVVFCEASAYGVPSITTDTGGVPTYVKNDENGYMLPLSAGADEFAQQIKTVFEDRNRFKSLREKSRIRFEKYLNWDAWVNEFNVIAAKLAK